MKKSIYSIIIGVGVLCVMGSCSKVELRNPIDSDNSKPEQVTVKNIHPFSGGATIIYNLPKDSKVRYVVAEYKLADGTQMHSKASFFTDSLVVKGFPDNGEYDVTVYSISYAEVRSDIQIVKVTPDLPPYLVAKESMKTKAIFGGISISYDNPLGSELEMTVLRKKTGSDSEQGDITDLDPNWSVIDRFVRTNKVVKYDVRPVGMEAVETQFAMVIRDRYNNTTDTIKRTLTPLYERMLDKSMMNPFPEGTTPIPGDIWIQHMANCGVPGLYDGIVDASKNIYFTKSDTGLPQGVSIDLGAPSILSRIVLWPRKNAASAYGHSFPKNIKFYGSNNPNLMPGVEMVSGVRLPDDSWTLIADCTCVTPSGAMAIDAVTAEDKEIVTAQGHSYDISSESGEAFRYIRLWTTDVWLTGNQFVVIAEMDVYGDYEKTE